MNESFGFSNSFWGGKMKPFILLIAAILCEIIATTALKESNGFRRLLPTLIVVIGYVAASYLFTISLRHIPLGVAYAVWSGLGTVGMILIGYYIWDEKIQPHQLAGIILILIGSVIINLSGETVT
jgi:multidrug transporter EmrE-like cation transporter